MRKMKNRAVYGCYIVLTFGFLLIFSNTEVVAADQSIPNQAKEYIYLSLAFSIVPQVSLVEYEPTDQTHP